MKKLQDLRESKHLSQKELGELLGVTDSAISQYEGGKRQPSIDMLKKISNIFSCSVDDLIN